MADVEYRCFIGGLSWSTKDDDLRDAFEKFGRLTEAKVVIDRDSGRSRGFGFVTFDDKKAMEEAIDAMNGIDLDGRAITVDKAQPQGGRREGEIVTMTVGMIVVVVTVVVTMAGEEALVVTASNVASLVILLGNAHLVMGVEVIGTVAGMIGMVVVGVVVVMEDLIAMGTVMAVDEAGMAEAVVGQEVTDTAVTALDHMNAPVEVEVTVLDNWHSLQP